MVHYSGHGCEREGQNYLVPVDGVVDTAAGAYNLQSCVPCQTVPVSHPDLIQCEAAMGTPTGESFTAMPAEALLSLVIATTLLPLGHPSL